MATRIPLHGSNQRVGVWGEEEGGGEGGRDICGGETLSLLDQALLESSSFLSSFFLLLLYSHWIFTEQRGIELNCDISP